MPRGYIYCSYERMENRMTISDLREEINDAAKHFHMQDRGIARKQASSLIRAKRTLAENGISATAKGSEFKYNKAGIIPKLFASTDHAAMLAELTTKINEGREKLVNVQIEYLRSPSPMNGLGNVIGRRITITLEGA